MINPSVQQVWSQPMNEKSHVRARHISNWMPFPKKQMLDRVGGDGVHSCQPEGKNQYIEKKPRREKEVKKKIWAEWKKTGPMHEYTWEILLDDNEEMKAKMVGVSQCLRGEGKIEVRAGPSFSQPFPSHSVRDHAINTYHVIQPGLPICLADKLSTGILLVIGIINLMDWPF